MPTYEYLCDTCTSKFEVICPISAHMNRAPCPRCGAAAFQTFSKIATHDDHPSWLDDNIRNQLQGENEKPIESRSEYIKYCRDRGIVAESAKR